MNVKISDKKLFKVRAVIIIIEAKLIHHECMGNSKFDNFLLPLSAD
jgi:hypothetical protein